MRASFLSIQRTATYVINLFTHYKYIISYEKSHVNVVECNTNQFDTISHVCTFYM